MKKTLLTIALFTAVTAAFAQKPAAGSFGAYVGMTSLTGNVTSGTTNTGSLGFRYLLKEDLAVRVGLNFGSLAGNGKTVVDNGNGTPSSPLFTTTEKTGTIFGLNLGIQKSLGGTDKLDPYVGADIYYRRSSGQETVENIAKPSDNYTKTTTIAAPSNTFGINGLVGFNYFFAQNLALGAEFAYGFKSTSSKGGGVSIEDKAGATTTTIDNSTPSNTSSANIIGVAGGSINLTWYFGSAK